MDPLQAVSGLEVQLHFAVRAAALVDNQLLYLRADEHLLDVTFPDSQVVEVRVVAQHFQ